MIDDSAIPEDMPTADEYDEAAKVAVIAALKSGSGELLGALQTMMDFTGGLLHIIGKAIEDSDENDK